MWVEAILLTIALILLKIVSGEFGRRHPIEFQMGGALKKHRKFSYKHHRKHK